jgi:hypothetical protein
MRHYDKEAKWEKGKYVFFRVKLDRQTYGKVLDRIKRIGNAKWLRKALGLFERKPELWEKEDVE